MGELFLPVVLLLEGPAIQQVVSMHRLVLPGSQQSPFPSPLQPQDSLFCAHFPKVHVAAEHHNHVP